MASLAAAHYAHYGKIQESWYRPPQPAGSLAVREVTDSDLLQRLAVANPGPEFSTRSDATMLMAVRPSVALRLEALAGSIDETTLETVDEVGLTIGQVGEPDAVWSIEMRPSEKTAMAVPSLIENGQVAIGRISNGRFARLATLSAVPTRLLGGGGSFPDVLVEALSPYGGAPQPTSNMALLGFVDLSDAQQGQVEGMARSIAPTAFVEVDMGFQDGGLYVFSQMLGIGAALLVALMAVALFLQLIAEEREFRLLLVRSGRSRNRRRLTGFLAFLPPSLSIAVASCAAIVFIHDTGDPDLWFFGWAPLAFVLASIGISLAAGFLHAREA